MQELLSSWPLYQGMSVNQLCNFRLCGTLQKPTNGSGLKSTVEGL